MKKDPRSHCDSPSLSRRSFLKAGGAALAGSALVVPPGFKRDQVAEAPPIQRHRTLGRTGFRVSDISLGCGYISEASVVRYAYDHGINYFDLAETYGNGDSERRIGEAMKHMDRSQIFITTKLVVNPAEDDESSLRERFAQCLERMKSDYADALYIHDVRNKSLVKNEAFHAVTAALKAEGRIKYVGISSHGPQGEEDDSMEDALLAAVADGRFDLMLLSYNYLNREEAERVLAACKEKKIGTTAMKATPCYLEVEPWDPENPYEGYTDYIDRVAEHGISREDAIGRIENWIAYQESVQALVQPFVDKHGIETQERFRTACIQWALRNPDMHTVCVAMPDFDSLARFLPLSGTQLSSAGELFLEKARQAFSGQLCRFGCTECQRRCPAKTPVSSIMRYRYYFLAQKREKHAMRKYAALAGRDASPCLSCDAPCAGACPHGVNIQAQMIKAHETLSLA